MTAEVDLSPVDIVFCPVAADKTSPMYTSKACRPDRCNSPLLQAHRGGYKDNRVGGNNRCVFWFHTEFGRNWSFPTFAKLSLFLRSRGSPAFEQQNSPTTPMALNKDKPSFYKPYGKRGSMI